MTRARWRWWLALSAMALGVILTRAHWLAWLGASLICPGGAASADAILLENFDPDYRLFERAAALQRDGWSARFVVPTPASADDGAVANPVSQAIVDVMARFARLREVQIVPVREVEPYTINAALQIRDVFDRQHVRSVLVLAPAFRSRRSALVYRAVLEPLGIRVHCLAVFGDHTPSNWTSTWHGIQIVSEQMVKLGFYGVYLLAHRP